MGFWGPNSVGYHLAVVDPVVLATTTRLRAWRCWPPACWMLSWFGVMFWVCLLLVGLWVETIDDLAAMGILRVSSSFRSCLFLVLGLGLSRISFLVFRWSIFFWALRFSAIRTVTHLQVPSMVLAFLLPYLFGLVLVCIVVCPLSVKGRLTSYVCSMTFFFLEVFLCWRGALDVL